MAHFAKIEADGRVLHISKVDDDKVLNAAGVEDEAVGQQYLEQHSNWPALMWVQTSYNTYKNTHNSGDNSKALRGNYAGIGYTWDKDNLIFWPIQPYASWVKDTATASWKSPIGDAPELTAEQIAQNEANTHRWYYDWNEDNQSWDLTNGEILIPAI